MLPVGFAVAEMLRSEYWVAHKMHTEFARLFAANGKPLPSTLIIVVNDKPIGYGDYGSEDPLKRAFVDCIIREAEWEFHDCKAFPIIGMDIEGIPEEDLAAFGRRTGSERREFEGNRRVG